MGSNPTGKGGFGDRPQDIHKLGAKKSPKTIARLNFVERTFEKVRKGSPDAVKRLEAIANTGYLPNGDKASGNVIVSCNRVILEYGIGKPLDPNRGMPIPVIDVTKAGDITPYMASKIIEQMEGEG